MLRKLIFVNESGQEITLPVTPPSYRVEMGMQVQTVDVYELGPYAVPTYPMLEQIKIECVFPSSPRPYCVSYTDQNTLLRWFRAQALAKSKLRYIVSGTQVNESVYIIGVTSGEQDGTNDLHVTLLLQPYRLLAAPMVQAGATAATPVREPAAPRSEATTYTIKSGDNLWTVAKRFYGDGGLYGKLATYNSIKNPNLIHAGQVLKIPDAGTLSATAATVAQPGKAASAAASTYVATFTLSGDARCSVSYNYVDQRSKVEKTGAITSGMKLTVSKGTSITVRWNGQSGYLCDKLTVDGVVQTGNKSPIRLEMTKDRTLDLHWRRSP